MMEEIVQKEQTPVVKAKPDKKIWLIGGIAVLVAAVAIVTVLVGGAKKEPCLKIATPYIELVLPLELEGFVTSDESTYGTVYTRAFYLNYGKSVLPLWRFDFGDANAGDWVGILKTDKGDVPVGMTGFVASQEELAALGEDGYKIYNECMDGYSVMLDGIMSDPRFTSERPLAVGENEQVKMTHWNVTLPNTMVVSESIVDGIYEAVFSGEVLGENVALYRISIGEEKEEVPLGYFKLDGVKKAVYVQSYELGEQDTWSEDDYAAAYRMMDTINDVINVIMQSKQFSIEAE